MKAAGYIRTSTIAQAREGESLRSQSDAIEKYAKEKGWDLIEIYEDAGISGAKADRPTLARLMDDARQGTFDALITRDLSRLARNAQDLLNIHKELEDFKIEIIFIKDDIDSTTHQGKLQLTMLAAFAEFERALIKERMAENKLIKWKEQRTFLGSPPYGYKWNKEKKELEIIPEEAKIYKNIISLYLDEGLSLKDITIRLSREGIRGRHGKFLSSTLSYMLKNTCYYGIYILNRHEYKGRKRTGEFKSEEEWISFPCPGIISKTLWDRIQEKIAFNKGKGKRMAESTKQFWLRDFLECDECGGRIRHKQDGRIKKDGTINRYYACFWRRASGKELLHSGKKKCELPYITAHELEEEIWGEIIARLTFGGWKIKGKRIKAPIEDLFDPEQFDREIDDLKEQIKRHEKELARLKRDYEKIADDLLKDEDFAKHKALFSRRLNENKNEELRITALLDQARLKIKETEEARDNQKSLQDFLTKNKKTLANLQEELWNLPAEDKKTLIEAMLDGKIRIGIELRPDTDEPHWARMPFKLRFNTAILKRFIAEGKLKSLAPNAQKCHFCLLDRTSVEGLFSG